MSKGPPAPGVDAATVRSLDHRDRTLDPDHEGHASGSISLARVASQYVSTLEVSASLGSVQAARRTLTALGIALSDVLAENVRPDAVHAWRLARVAAGASNKTANTDVGVLRAALQLAVRLGQIRANPLAGIRRLPTGARHQRRKPRALSDWELARLFAAADAYDLAHPKQFPRAALLAALALTGARWGELTSTSWSDLDLERGTLRFVAETTKTQTERVIPLRRDLVEVFRAVRDAHVRERGSWPLPSSPVFASRLGVPWVRSKGVFHKWFGEMLRKAGIPKRDERGRIVCVHALRHTFATRLARAGVPIAQAQVLTGHKTVSMLLGVYTDLRAEEVRESVESLPGIPVGGRIEDDAGGARTCAPPG